MTTARPPFRRGGRRRRQCFCKESTVDYKDVSSIRRFISDRGRIEAGSKAGNCAKCQRTLTTAIKRARHLALLPYAPHHQRVTSPVTTKAKLTDEEAPEEATEETPKATADEFAAAPKAAEESKPQATEAEESSESSSESEEATEDVSTTEASETEEADEESSDEEEK